MAKTGVGSFLVLLSAYCFRCHAVELDSNNRNPTVNEFQSVELSCIIKATSTPSPRIEWKKTSKDIVTFVYFQNKVSGPLENRAVLRDRASLFIQNTTRSDSGLYRCEVSAPIDSKMLGEVFIELTVQVKPVAPRCHVPKSVPVGKSAELLCAENEGYPPPTYRWYRNGDQIPEDPRSSHKFLNSSYAMDLNAGTLKFRSVKKVDAGEYFCVAQNPAGTARCGSQKMEVYDIDIVGIIIGVLVVVIVLVCITVGICCAYKRGYFVSKKQASSNYKPPTKGDGVDFVRGDEEGDFRHKSSFVI
ncbi:junctional adhesion molecule 3B [Erpetoichthys calabaricus]|nr:junctional adhesion molecule 3B [Erpetoichthys calabaricus]